MQHEPMPESAEEAGILAREGMASIAYVRQLGKRPMDRPGIMFLGGFRSDMTGIKAQHLGHFARGSGQDYLRFDYRGHGAGSPDFARYALSDWIRDAIDAIDQLTEGPQILVGSSMGGAIMQHVALARPDRVAGLVGIASASDFTERLMWPKIPEDYRARMAADGFITVPSLYDPAGYVITRNLIEDGRRHLLLPGPIAITCPVRLLHGLADPDVPWSLSVELADALGAADVVVTLIKDGDHRLSEPDHLARIAEAVAELSSPGSSHSPGRA